MVPAFIANMTPVFVKNHFTWMAIPVDGGIKLNHQPLFGNHKTVRGFVCGIAMAILIAYLQKQLYQYPLLQAMSYINYAEISFVSIGFLLGFGALFGDLVKSFIKRRLNHKPGTMFFPWDEVDAWIGAMVFISIVKPLHMSMVLFYILVIPLLHLAANYIGYKLKLKEVMW